MVDTTRWILDNMELFFENKEYPDSVYARLETCLVKFSTDDLYWPDAAKNGWEGMLEYGIAGGTDNDEWGKRIPQYLENCVDDCALTLDNSTVTGAADIQLVEPCNYVSNIAYYRSMIELCERDAIDPFTLPEETVRALGQTFASLAFGSAFFHGSGTGLGNFVDVVPIQMYAYVAHQASMSSLPFSPVLHELQSASLPPRGTTGIEIANEFGQMLRDASVFEWDAIMRTFDMPGYTLTFGVMVATYVDLIFGQILPDDTTRILQQSLPLIMKRNDVDFVINEFLPEFRAATAEVQLSGMDRVTMGKHGVATLIKMIYAFLWQEEATGGDYLRDEQANIVGAEIMPQLNALANSISGWTYADTEFQTSVDPYPGADTECRVAQPHSKWHEQGGIGLIDLILLAQDADTYLRNAPIDDRDVEFGLPGCLVTNDCLSGIVDGDFSGIIGCVQRVPILNPNPVCGELLDAVGLLACAGNCADERGCILGCFVEYADLGPKPVDGK